MPTHTVKFDIETNNKLKYYKVVHGTNDISETIAKLAARIIIPSDVEFSDEG